jgi:hypothetical protein
LKVLIYALPKTGKSHFVHTACQVGPVLWMDTEHGSDYYDPGAGHDFEVAYAKDPELALKAIEHANSIVAIDSVSSVWFMQQEVAEQLTTEGSRGKTQGRTSFRAWGPAKKPLKKVYDVVMLSRCHVVMTARAKVQYETVNNEPVEKGLGPDMEKGTAYAVDIVLETGHDEGGYYATVTGSRSP